MSEVPNLFDRWGDRVARLLIGKKLVDAEKGLYEPSQAIWEGDSDYLLVSSQFMLVWADPSFEVGFRFTVLDYCLEVIEIDLDAVLLKRVL